nr:DeoR/GlpR family DNA-binding transcription regulator [uncultured Celeribacter sp.]
MKAEQFGPELRQNALRRRLERGSALFLSTAAKEFGVSVDSIRRDLKALEEQGIARCIRGGALPVARPVRPALERMATTGELADRLAEAALPLVEDGMVLAFDGGTNVLALAQRLPALPNSLAVTPAPAVALATLAAGIPTQLIGGRVSVSGAISVGPDTIAALAGIAVDLAFLGVCGLEAEFGLSADDADESHTKRAMIAASHRSIVLTGAEKLGRRARHRVVPCDALDIMITDADECATASLASTGLDILNA